MARWRLKQPHYLNSPGTEWEYKEVSRETGKQARKVFEVPTYVDTDTIVCHVGKGQRDDVEFIGDPTPDMEPLDDEAEKISAQFSERWIHPIETLSDNYGADLISMFEKQMAAMLRAMPNQPAPKADEVAELRAQVQALTEQLSKLVPPASAPAATVRRS